jgi:RsiW-degrading membrane proteinase PrsW (M82 family)
MPGPFEIMLWYVLWTMLIGVPCMLIGYLLAQRKRRPPIRWAIRSLFFSIFALALLIVLPTLSDSGRGCPIIVEGE